jgi:hypothetical protein
MSEAKLVTGASYLGGSAARPRRLRSRELFD